MGKKEIEKTATNNECLSLNNYPEIAIEILKSEQTKC